MSEQTKSDNFEQELDEFFKERALFRTQTVSDRSMHQVSKERCNENVFKKPDSEHANNGSKSGCCMTGCHDCPWGYAG